MRTGNARYSASSGSSCATLGMPARCLSASQAAAVGREWGEVAGEWPGPVSGVRLTGCTPEDASVTWCTGLTLVRASSGARLVPPAGMAAVQHGSTATHPDAGGLVGTWEDGDLHRETRVDVLPPDGMQEVRSSNLLSSTGQKRNSNRSNSEYSRKVQQRRPVGPPYVCSDRPRLAHLDHLNLGTQPANPRYLHLPPPDCGSPHAICPVIR